MGLMNCPDCRKSISTNAESCPNCGNTKFELRSSKPQWGTCKHCRGTGLDYGGPERCSDCRGTGRARFVFMKDLRTDSEFEYQLWPDQD